MEKHNNTANVKGCLVTGSTGCIGAWVVRGLVHRGIPITALDIGDSHHRLELIMTRDELASVNFIKGDVGELVQVTAAIEASKADSVIHLAALQLPFCKKDPSLGARVNVQGTVNIFEAAKRARLKRVIYASSTAVYGYASEYTRRPIHERSPLKPKSLYGVYKQANENTAMVYWINDGLSSIGIRPHVVYGPGRDQGMTSTPTQAMLAAAAGEAYRISFGGHFCFQYVEDVANVFVQSLSVDHEGADVYNIGGPARSIGEIIQAIEQAQPGARGKISYEDTTLPFPGQYDNLPLTALLEEVPSRPLEQGVEETISIFTNALADRRILINR